MADEQRRPAGESELEHALRELGYQLDLPPTPPIAGSVRQRLAAHRRPRPSAFPWWVRRRLVLAAAVALLLIGLALALAPGGLPAVAERLGLRGVTIEAVPAVPTPTPTPTPTPHPTVAPTARPPTGPAALPSPTPSPAAGTRLQLGQRVTLAEARQLARYPLQMPMGDELGSPDEVWIDGAAPGQPVALIYRARPGWPAADESGVAVLLIQFQAEPEAALLGKGIGPETTLEEVMVAGRRGYWIAGQPHTIFFRDRSGATRTETVRLAGNVLLWSANGVTLRLEGRLSRERALRIADATRP